MSIVAKLIIALIICIPVTASAMPPHPKVVKEWKDKGIYAQKMQARSARKALGIDKPVKAFPTTGNRNVLVILIQFSDINFDAADNTAFYSDLLNGATPTSMSARKYYQDMSDNDLNLTFTVVGPFTADNNHNYYGSSDANARALAGEAITKANPTVNFATYDNDNDGAVDGVIVIHPGPGEEYSGNSTDIWSHNWTLSPTLTCDGKTISNYTMQPEYNDAVGDSTIGVFCHEFGHMLGLPDLYDNFYETWGVGDWSLMAGGSWNGATGYGDIPAPLLAWERIKLGWASSVNVAEVPPAGGNRLPGILISLFILIASAAGVFTRVLKYNLRRYATAVFVLVAVPLVITMVPGCGGGGSDTNYGQGISGTGFSVSDIETSHVAAKIPLNDPYGLQYLLLENIVQTTGRWNEYLPGDGLLITMIDEEWINETEPYNLVNGAENTSNYYYPIHGVKILEADGMKHLWTMANQGDANDTFYLGNKTSVTPDTSPNTRFTLYANAYNALSYSGSPYSKNSGVSVTNISAKGNNMTFDWEY